MGFFDRPDKAIDQLHKKAEELATQAKHAKDPKRRTTSGTRRHASPARPPSCAEPED